jgi:hypothetical protein
MPYDQARASLELFAREVLPKARGLNGKAVSALRAAASSQA